MCSGPRLSITTLSALRELLVQIMFAASIQHTAVSAPQWQGLSFIPAKPFHLRKVRHCLVLLKVCNLLLQGMPENMADLSWQYIVDSLPNFDETGYILSLACTLSLPEVESKCLLQSYRDRRDGMRGSQFDVSVG